MDDIWNTDSTTMTSNYWPYWTQALATNTVTIQWRYWVKNTYSSQIVSSSQLQNFAARQGYIPPAPRVRTAAEIAEEARQQARYLEERRATQRRMAEILERAEGLLMQHLTELQRKEYKKHRHITVRSQTGRKFRLGATHSSGNIILLNDKDEQVSKYCAHPWDVPMPDTLLSQIMHLRHNEAEFLARANRHA